jgi:hypothetical protein
MYGRTTVLNKGALLAQVNYYLRLVKAYELYGAFHHYLNNLAGGANSEFGSNPGSSSPWNVLEALITWY